MALGETYCVTNATALFDMFEDIAETPAHVFNYGVLKKIRSEGNSLSYYLQLYPDGVSCSELSFVTDDNLGSFLSYDTVFYYDFLTNTLEVSNQGTYYSFTRSDITVDTLVMDINHKTE